MAVALALVVLAQLAPGAAGAWDQAGGDAAHSGRGAPGPLDVAATFRLAPDGMDLMPGPAGLLDVGDAMLALARDPAAGTCHLVRAASGAAPTADPGPGIACPLGATLEAWDAQAGHALVCRAGPSSSGLLVALAPGGAAPAWTASPRLETPDPFDPVPSGTVPPGTVPPAQGPAQGTAGTWSCRGIAVGGGHAYVAFGSSEGRNRVEARRLGDGSVAWSATVPSSILLQGADPDLVPTPAQDASGAFAPTGVVLTATGVLVAGHLDGTSTDDAPPGLAWFGLDGAFNGAIVNAPVPTADAAGVASTTLMPTSAGSAASGPLAAHLVGRELVVVDPRNSQATRTELGSPSLGQPTLAAPCWGRETLVVPGESFAFLLSATDPTQPRTWPGLGAGRVQGCAVGAGGEVWLAVRREENGTKVDAAHVQLATGRTLARLPVPIAAGPATDLGTHMLALPDGHALAPRGGLVVWDGSGEAALLAPDAAIPAPDLAIADPYATVGAPATVTVAAGQAPAERLLLAWGDGFLEEVPLGGGELSHVYEEAGTRTVTLTAVAADGRTASARSPMMVGTPAPPPRGILEVAFDPENQNVTFLLIGFLVSGIGAGLTVLGVQRGRRRLDRHLAELERIRDGGRRDPFGAVRQLHAFRVREREALAKGHLEDAQYTIVEGAAVHVLEILRGRILGTFVGRVTPRFSHALDLALSDGAIDAAEGGGLAAMAEAEPDLRPDERARLADLVRSWQRIL